MKKILSICLVIILIITALPLGAFEFKASAETEGYYTYTVSGGKATIADVDTSISGDITVPSTLGGYPVTNIAVYAFEDCASLTSITIPNSVISIGDRAFYSCSSLESITLPFVGSSRSASGTCDAVFGYIFGYTSSSKNGTTKQYYNLGGLNYYYYIPSSLKSVTITDTTQIPYGAFYNCESLTSIIISDSVTSIGVNAFSYCKSLTSINIPNSVTSIGAYAFYDCISLTRVNITDIATWCNISFGYTDANPLYYAKNLYLNGNLVTDLVIPDSVTSIGNYAFYSCTSLTNVTISDSVASIGSSAFYNTGYYNNSSNWENDVLYIGNHLIEAKTSISGIYSIKEGTVTITGSAFYSCTSLTSVTIPNSVISIGDEAFNRCNSITSITIPNSVTNVGAFTFSNCTNLTSVTIPDSVTSIGRDAFSFCDSLISITIPNSVTSIGDRAFCYCSRLTSINIPNSVTSIGDSAFYDCTSLTRVTIGDSATNIGAYVFSECQNLENVTIGNSVTSIGYRAFENCSSLTSIYYRGSNEEKSKISINSGNNCLLKATWYCNSCIGSAEHTYSNDKFCDICGYKDYIIGDIDGVGVVDLSDVSILAKCFAGWNVEVNEDALDCNGDGKVNLNDLVLLAQFVAGWEVELH